MDESVLLRIALAVSITGLLALFTISRLIELPLTDIGDIQTEEQVVVKGIIGEISEHEKVSYIELIHPSKVQAIVFSPPGLNLNKGDYVSIEAEVREFKNEKQLVADKIKLLS